MNLNLGRFRVNEFLSQYACHAKTSNFVENFGSSMVQFRSIRLSCPFSGQHILDIGYETRSFGSGSGSWVSFARSSIDLLDPKPVQEHVEADTKYKKILQTKMLPAGLLQW